MSTLKNHIIPAMFLGTAALLLTSCAREGDPAEVIVDTTPTSHHIVAKGDTLDSIASTYGLSKKTLIKINRLKPPYKLYKGQRLLVQDDGNTEDNSRKQGIKAKTNVADTGDVEVQELNSAQNNEATAAPATMGSGVPGSNTFGGAGAATTGGITAGSIDGGTANSPQTPMAPEPQKVEAPMSSGRMTWPAQGQVIKSFGVDATGQRNDGINIAVPAGTPVTAVDNGVVAHVGNKAKGFGNLVLIKHQGGKISVYGHLQEASVREGQQVAAGEKIGLAGSSGGVNQPQVHFELRQGKTALNPQDYLK